MRISYCLNTIVDDYDFEKKMIDTILSVAKTLFGFKDVLDKSHRDRKDRIASYFESISKCLAEISSKLKANKVPHGRCAEMKFYASQLPNTVGDVIGKAEAQRLAKDLESAHEVELLLSKLYQSPDRASQLAKLDEASGIFQALANSIRAEPL